jgi:hypothetical protein
MINAFWEPVRFQIQQPGPWNCVVDTSRQDLATRAVDGLNYEVAPRSVVVLERARTDTKRVSKYDPGETV